MGVEGCILLVLPWAQNQMLWCAWLVDAWTDNGWLVDPGKLVYIVVWQVFVLENYFLYET